MSNYDMVIIGAGISGLSMSHYCAAAGLKTLLIEKAARVGGSLHTHYLDGDASYWVEMGAHTCYNSYENLISLIEHVGLQASILRRERYPFRLLRGNELVSVGSQLRFTELLFHLPRLLWQTKSGESVKSYYSRILGQQNFEVLFSSLFNAVSCQQADDIPADFLFKRRPRRKDFPKSFSFTTGLQQLADGLIDNKHIDSVTGVAVTAVRRSGDGFEVIDEAGDSYHAQFLVLATPSVTASHLLSETFPELGQRLSQIQATSIETLSVIVPAEQTSFPLSTGVVPLGDNFYSIVTRDVLPDSGYRGFTFHFKPASMEKDEKIEKVCEVIDVQREGLLDVASKSNILPIPRLGHHERIREIDFLLHDSPLFLTGNYFMGMGIEDCVVRSRFEFDRLKEQAKLG